MRDTSNGEINGDSDLIPTPHRVSFTALLVTVTLTGNMIRCVLVFEILLFILMQPEPHPVILKRGQSLPRIEVILP